MLRTDSRPRVTYGAPVSAEHWLSPIACSRTASTHAERQNMRAHARSPDRGVSQSTHGGSARCDGEVGWAAALALHVRLHIPAITTRSTVPWTHADPMRHPRARTHTLRRLHFSCRCIASDSTAALGSLCSAEGNGAWRLPMTGTRTYARTHAHTRARKHRTDTAQHSVAMECTPEVQPCTYNAHKQRQGERERTLARRASRRGMQVIVRQVERTTAPIASKVDASFSVDAVVRSRD